MRLYKKLIKKAEIGWIWTKYVLWTISMRLNLGKNSMRSVRIILIDNDILGQAFYIQC